MNFLNDYSAYNKLTSGFKINTCSNVNAYILISKISRVAKDYYFKNEELANNMLPRSRYDSYDVLNRFIDRLEELNIESLKKILILFERNVFKTIRMVEKYPIKLLMKKKVLVNGK